MTIIDVHAHHLPERLGEVFTRLSGRRYPLSHKEDHSRRIEDLDSAGIDQQVLGLGAVQPYWSDESASVEGARYANDLYAQMCADVAKFRAFGAVPLPHAAAAATEAARCLDELGFAGIGLGCSADGTALDDPRLDEFWGALDERSATVYLHPGVKNDLAVGVSEYPMLLGPVFGSPSEEAVAIVRLVLKGTLRRFPRITWIAGAMGGSVMLAHSKLFHSLSLPGKLSGGADVEEIRAHLHSFFYDTSSLDPVLAVGARQAGLVDRLIFGSDAPFGSAVSSYRTLEEILPDDRKSILERGAVALS